MKKFKKFLTNKKSFSKSETTLAQSEMAKKGSMLSLGSKKTGDYEIKPKDLEKIHKAVIDKDVKKVEKLAVKGVNSRDAQDRTPMHLACSMGNKEVVATLLSFKPLLTVPDKQHKTPLFKAIEGGFTDIANMLVIAQKDLKAVDHDGNNCLHYASIHGLADVTKSILNKMPLNFVNVANKTGKTALHFAVANNHAETVKNLVSKGANLKATDNQGDTPTSIAKIQNNEDVLKALNMNDSPSSRSNKSSSSTSIKTSSNDSAEEIESKPVTKTNNPSKPTPKSISGDEDDSSSFSSKSSPSKKQPLPKTQSSLKQPSSLNSQTPLKSQLPEKQDLPMKSPPKSPKNDDHWLSDSQSQVSSDSEEKDNMKKKMNESNHNEKMLKNEIAPVTRSELNIEKTIKPSNNSDFDSDSDGEDKNIPHITPVKKDPIKNDLKNSNENSLVKLDSRKVETVDKTTEDETKYNEREFSQEPETSKAKVQEESEDSPWDSSDDDDVPAKKPITSQPMTDIPQKKLSFSFDTSDDEDKEETKTPNENNKAPKLSESNKRMSSVENHIPSLVPAITDSKESPLANEPNEKKTEEKATEDKRKASTTSSKLSFLRKLSSVGPILTQKKKGRKVGVVDSNYDENDKNKNYENDIFNIDNDIKDAKNNYQNSDGNDDYDDLLEKLKMAEKELDVSKRVEESLKKEKKNLINELKDLRENHEEKLNELTAQIFELEKNNRRVMETKEVSTRKEEFLASEVDRLTSENDALKSLNDELHQKMMEDGRNGADESVINELHLLRGKLQITENDLQNANMQITSQQEKNLEGNGFLSEKVKQLSSQLQQQEAICLEHKREMAQQKSHIKSLEIEIEELNNKKALKESEWNDLKKQLSNKDLELKSIKDDRNHEKDTRMKMELELTSLNEKLDKERGKWNDKAKEDNTQISNQVALIQEEVNSMKEKNDFLKKTIEKGKEESKNKEDMLRREIETLEKERDSLFEKHLKVESSMQSASMSKKLKEGEISDLKEEIESLKVLVERGKIKEKSLESKIEELNKTLRDFKAREGVQWEEEEERRKLVDRVQKLEVDKVRLSAELRNERVEIDRLRDQLETINNEDERLRRSLERKSQAEVKLKIEREKIESLEQQLNHYKQASNYEKTMKPVRKFLIDNARKKDDERILELIETLRSKLQQDTKKELLAKVQQVTTFLDEQTVKKTSGEERKSEWAFQNDKAFDGSLFAKRMQELRTCLQQLKKSEALLINRLNHPFNSSAQTMEQPFNQSSHLVELTQLNGFTPSSLNYSSHNFPKSFEYLNETEDKTYTTKKLLKQLEESINKYNIEKL